MRHDVLLLAVPVDGGAYVLVCEKSAMTGIPIYFFWRAGIRPMKQVDGIGGSYVSTMRMDSEPRITIIVAVLNGEFNEYRFL